MPRWYTSANSAGHTVHHRLEECVSNLTPIHIDIDSDETSVKAPDVTTEGSLVQLDVEDV